MKLLIRSILINTVCIKQINDNVLIKFSETYEATNGRGWIRTWTLTKTCEINCSERKIFTAFVSYFFLAAMGICSCTQDLIYMNTSLPYQIKIFIKTTWPFAETGIEFFADLIIRIHIKSHLIWCRFFLAVSLKEKNPQGLAFN